MARVKNRLGRADSRFMPVSRTLLPAGALIATLAVAAGGAPAGAATAKPKLTAADGVVVAQSQVKTVADTTCARIGGVWHPGTLVAKTGRFQTFTLQARTARTAAKRAHGKKRRNLLRKADRLDQLVTGKRALCRLRVTPTYAPGSSPAYYPPYVPVAPTTNGSGEPLRFGLKSAVGVATRAATGRSTTLRAGQRSNLVAVGRDGTVEDAVTSGFASVGQFLIAPNNRLYVLFSSAASLDGSYGSKPCLLAEVDKATGVPTCVDNTLAWVSWNNQSSSGGNRNNPAVQFDDSGAVYYEGTDTSGRTVLRRSSGGVTTDLVSDFGYAGDFIVLPDGAVILTGTTTATGARWIRRISPQGTLSTLRTEQSSFMRRFPDGNVYMGVDRGVARYVPDSGAMDPALWIGNSYSDDVPSATTPHFNARTICADDYQAASAFCSWLGGGISASFTTPDKQVFVISGSSPAGLLMQYYPRLARPRTAVVKVSVAAAGSAGIVLSGLDSTDHNVTTLFDPSSGTERTLIAGSDETELYHVDYLPDSTTVMFDGLRFRDNAYVLGQIDLTTGTVTATTPLPGRLANFATFK